MHSRNPVLLTLLALACGLALGAAPASARTNVIVGIGDQNASMFDSPAYQALKLKRTRYFIRWDAIRTPDALAKADAFVARAREARVSVLMHISNNDLRRKKGTLPSVARYKRDVGRLVRRYRAKGVREWGVWNEANHDSQPTYRSPRRAAEYFLAMRTFCGGCTIVALDVLDQAGVDRYISKWFAAIPRSKRSRARLVGIHNYSDTNRKRSTGTARIIRTVKRSNSKADFWLTETGGLVSFGTSFPCSERRAASRTDYMFSLAKRYRRDVKRLYAYNWTGTNCETRFDAGLVRIDGTPRPAYTRFKKQLSTFLR